MLTYLRALFMNLHSQKVRSTGACPAQLCETLGVYACLSPPYMSQHFRRLCKRTWWNTVSMQPVSSI